MNTTDTIAYHRAEIRYGTRASGEQAERLLVWVAAWPERTCAVEGAEGVGHAETNDLRSSPLRNPASIARS